MKLFATLYVCFFMDTLKCLHKHIKHVLLLLLVLPHVFLPLLVVSDLVWIQVRSADEAWRILKAGRRNQSFASTHLNMNSSRR